MTHFWPDGDPISVLTDAAGQPVQFTWQGQTHTVQHIANRWRLDDEWWRGRVWREYFKVTTEAGGLMLLYHNVLGDQWYVQRLYD